MFQVTFLGTAGSLPTPDRSPSAVLVNREGELHLFDCGEGTQRQMMLAKTGMMRLGHIFLSHLHADHILGIPGLLETMAFQGRTEPLTIAGPARTSSVMKLFSALGCCSKSFPIEVLELAPGDEISMDGYRVLALETYHSVPSLGYCLVEDMRPGRFNRSRAVELGVPPGPLFGRLQRGETIVLDGRFIRSEEVMGPPRRGRKLVYTGDTRPCQAVEEAARDADILIHDSALADDMLDWAVSTRHSTAGEAGALAARAKARLLVLTHISSRYSEDTTSLLEDARRHFRDVIVAADLMRIDVPLRDD